MACDPIPEPIEVLGMSPIYSTESEFTRVKTEAPREISELGKIVNVGDYIFINEINQGIHVVDNSDPFNPEFIHFFAIFGNTEFTIEGTTLYADNSKDLYVIDISDFDNIVLTLVIPDQYGTDYGAIYYRPPNYQGPFECVNLDLGIPQEWELILLTDPSCNAF